MDVSLRKCKSFKYICCIGGVMISGVPMQVLQ